MKLFKIALDREIKEGLTTDIYFIRTKKILEKLGLDQTRVILDISFDAYPYNWSWGVISGIYEALTLMEGLPLDLYFIEEGTILPPRDVNGYRMVIGYVEGAYGPFSIYETPLLGLLCQSSGISTYAAHVRVKAWNKMLLSFGARRMHPSITPMIDYAAYIGGFDGVSSVLSAKMMGLKPMGTMPHALILIIGDQKKAWVAFDKFVEGDVPRIALVDTLYDEKIESLMAAESLDKKLYGVRLDTPGSRRGNLADIVREVRMELDQRGYSHVKIFVSGGIRYDNITPLVEAGVDGFGIGTGLSNAPTVDFAIDIVVKEGKPYAKRGKIAGRKYLFRCPECFVHKITFDENDDKCPKCGDQMLSLIRKAIDNGKIIIKPKTPSEIRNYVLKQLSKIMELGWGD
jgi:nicotinate phosphoribosyltransferase